MSALIPMSGKRFGRLLVVKRVDNRGGRVRWECLCDCGSSTEVTTKHLRNGNIKSCGCLGIESRRLTKLKHGMYLSAEYRIWQAIRDRCENPKNNRFHIYGMRGIAVCDRWQDFSLFYADMGPKPFPKATIDRIDNSKGYEPGNCRWTDRVTQANNCRSNHRITYLGKTLTIAQWSRLLGINSSTIISRIHLYHWSDVDSLSIPVRSHK